MRRIIQDLFMNDNVIYNDKPKQLRLRNKTLQGIVGVFISEFFNCPANIFQLFPEIISIFNYFRKCWLLGIQNLEMNFYIFSLFPTQPPTLWL